MKRDEILRKFLAVLLCAAMIITYMPSSVYASTGDAADDIVAEETASEPVQKQAAEPAPAPAEKPAPEPKAAEPAPAPVENPAPAVEAAPASSEEAAPAPAGETTTAPDEAATMAPAEEATAASDEGSAFDVETAAPSEEEPSEEAAEEVPAAATEEEEAEENNTLSAQEEVTAQEVSVQINGNSVEKPYNGEYQDGVPYTLTWFVDGEEVSEAPEGVSFSNTAGLDCPNAKNAGSYQATITGKIVVTDTEKYTAGEVTADKEYNGITHLVITPLPITIALTGNNDTVKYDGKAHTVTGLTFEVSGLLDCDEDIKITINGQIAASTAGTAVGTYPMNMKAEDFTASLPTGNNNYTVSEIEIKEDGWLKIEPAEITIVIKGTEKEYDYDGSAKIAEGYEATCDSPLYDKEKLSYEGEIGSTGTDAGEYPYELSESGFKYEDENVTATYQITGGNLVINPVKVTVATGSDEKVYDGEALTNSEATITGLVEKDEGKVTVKATGSQTEVGSSDNTYEIDWNGVNEKNYTITEELGTLTVTKPEPETAKITYDLNGGEYGGSTADIVESYAVGEEITIHEAPIREGYEFLYWEGSEYYPGDKYTVEGDHTFKAIWVAEGEDEEEPDEPEEPGVTEKPDKPDKPDTGDHNELGGWLALMMLAAAGAADLYSRRRREDK